MLEEKKLKLADANILYLIGAILFFTMGFYFQHLSLKWGLIITQYVLVLLPPILYLKVKRIPIKKTMRFNKISVKHGFLVIFITLFMYPTAVLANAIFMMLMSLLGNLNIPELPTATNPTEYIVLLFIISISAGICEEVFFRGFILPGYENLGSKKAIVISSILFGIFHFNLYNLFGPMVLGLVFSYLVILTDSIYAGMIGHIVNNGFAVTLGYILNKFAGFLEQGQETSVEISTTLALLMNIAVFGIIAIVTGFFAFRLIKIIKKDREKQKMFLEENNLQEEDKKYIITKYPVSLKDFIPLLFVLPLFLLIAIIQIREIIRLG
ncbi:type II CAAX endopeptidase family protein [Clostridium formicaceticum]|uniref:Abortive infection protein n=1 Tax=Clostridium formicaceticum TaxID=1497 RepID=A0AAC9RIN4_9CLOT|nr:type II CAAX endopeptidase family protein [Clostridium formicaceticum]AOY76364.1 abortive infection protein [Clostridium formicaceticum]ARE86756.1 CAAX amino terminal protease self- immunity [Clostridium formicaceticum]